VNKKTKWEKKNQKILTGNNVSKDVYFCLLARFLNYKSRSSCICGNEQKRGERSKDRENRDDDDDDDSNEVMDENEKPLHQTEEKRRERKTQKNLQVTIMYLKTFFFGCLFICRLLLLLSCNSCKQKKRVEKDKREKKEQKSERIAAATDRNSSSSNNNNSKKKGRSARVHACGEGYEWMNEGWKFCNNDRISSFGLLLALAAHSLPPPYPLLSNQWLVLDVNSLSRGPPFTLTKVIMMPEWTNSHQVASWGMDGWMDGLVSGQQTQHFFIGF